MVLSKDEIFRLIKAWLVAWDVHNLEGVMELIHDEIVFENWTGAIVSGKNNLKRLWGPWFLNHGDFSFFEEDIFIDEQEQKVLFSWRLHWHSLEKFYKGKPEIRRGVDILHFKNGKILKKYSYIKTSILIDSIPILLSASKPINNE